MTPSGAISEKNAKKAVLYYETLKEKGKEEMGTNYYNFNLLGGVFTIQSAFSCAHTCIRAIIVKLYTCTKP